MQNFTTKEKTAAIKKALVPEFGAKNVSVTKGSGTASHWIHTNVEIPIPAGCSCDHPGISWGDKMCAPCRAAYDAADKKMNTIANKVIATMGGYSSYYSDDYSDSRPYDCHLAKIKFIRPAKPISPAAVAIVKPEWDAMKETLATIGKDGMLEALDDLKKADASIKAKHRYPCGIESEGGVLVATITPIKARLFFNSPDGQNGELYYALRALGYRHVNRQAEYYWTVAKGNTEISYVEGDVYVVPLTVAKVTA